MAFGFGVLRLSPAYFWTLTPQELAAAVRGRTASSQAAMPTRQDLHDLMRQFPDQNFEEAI